MIEARPSLLKLNQRSDQTEAWFHLSVQRGAYILRLVGEKKTQKTGRTENVSDELSAEYEVQAQVPMPKVRELAQHKGKVGYLDAKIFQPVIQNIDERLVKGLPPWETTSIKGAAADTEFDDPIATSRLLRVTQLRSVYRMLRKVSAIEFHQALARGFCEHPRALVKMIDRSRKLMTGYRNDESFLEEKRKDLSDRKPGQIMRTPDLVAKLQKREEPWEVADYPHLAFRYLEREVSPLRTTKGRWESGKKARNSGGGGIDVLLLNATDNHPIVGEVKIENDATPLLALIQALMYTTELSTPAQFKRLKDWAQKNYGKDNEISPPPEQPSLDVYLIQFRPPSNDNYKICLQHTKELCRLIFTFSERPSWLRRIVMLKAVLPMKFTLDAIAPHQQEGT